MAPQLRLFEPCPSELRHGGGGDSLIESCSVQFTDRRLADLQRSLAASAALAAAAEHAESVAIEICSSAADDPLLQRVASQFLRRFPRWDYLPALPALPGRDWRLLLEQVARGLPSIASPAQPDTKGAR